MRLAARLKWARQGWGLAAMYPAYTRRYVRRQLVLFVVGVVPVGRVIGPMVLSDVFGWLCGCWPGVDYERG